MNNVPRETIKENPSIEGFSGIKVIDLKDYFLTQEEFSIYKDDKTGVHFTFPQPLNNLSRYYESENYISHTDGKKSLFEKIYQIAKQYNLDQKLKLIKESTQGKSILDYGCGAGDFLQHMQKNGYDVTGMEPNPKANEISKSKIGNENVVNCELKDINQKFDIITMWHVLEHIPNLNEILAELKKHLNPGGTLIIAVPNHLSYDANYYGKYWAAYDVPRHLWHFNPESIKRLVNNFGMKIENVSPMKLDAFYVSLLSEKYKGNSFPFLKAFCIGLKSNRLAQKTGQYSSLIYTIKANK
jgi:2-polyprenyl-3-methyl-5-hydroxy-6-metoxy-1,4-benzoquinol methylase